MGDAHLARRRQQVMDPVTLSLPVNDYADPTRSSRPVSWHPSTHLPPPQAQLQPQSQYFLPMGQYRETELYSYQHFPPTPATYSCDTSPSTAFSPLSLPYNGFDAVQYGTLEGWPMPPQSTPSYVSSSDSSSGFSDPFPPLQSSGDAGLTMSAMEWNSFVMQGFNSTSPPTPEAMAPTQQTQRAIPSEACIEYQPLEEPEEEGEILVGMGLYDTPGKYDSDPHLDHYRSTTSQLLGTTYRGQEPTGKGLKLEESWQPPEEEEDADEEGEDDAEGDDQDAEEKSDKVHQTAPTQVATTATAAGGNWI